MTDEQNKAVRVEYGLMKAHALAALSALFISALIGLFISTKMHLPDMASAHAWSSWGRMRYDHTQGIFFGWLGNVFLFFMYHLVPRLCGRPVLSSRLGWLLFFLWNFCILIPGWLLVLCGQSQALEWAEFPLVIDYIVVFALFLSALQFVLPLLKANLSRLYVSGWYLIGALVFTLLAYPVGNIIPQIVPGTQGAAFSGLWIHDAIGLYVTPLALAITYWVIPAATGRPIYSHFLSMIGFWLLFFVYPLNGTHHYVYSSIPMEAQIAAITASVLLGVDVILVVSNLFLSLKGCSEKLKTDWSLRFVRMGTIFYLLVALQGSLQSLMPVNKIIHFSDWVIGHSHLAMIGFASFTAIGGMAHAWQKIPGAKFNARALAHAYWLLLAGLLLMFGTLTAAGLAEADIWQKSGPFLDSVREVKVYWMIRTGSGILILGAFISLFVALFTNPRKSQEKADLSVASEPEPDPESFFSEAAPAQAKASSPLLNMAYLSLAVAGLGFFVISFAALAVLPGLAVNDEIKKNSPKTIMPLTAAEERGREIYAREGCAYCHTQQVRKVACDVERYGAPTRAWETVYDYPHLWGTRRVGPDLARESSVRSNDWQLAHLYNPRSVIRDSVMPPYPWLFDQSAQAPRQEALDLLAYLNSLGRQRELSAVLNQSVPAYCDCDEEVKKLESSPAILNANPARARQSVENVNFLAEEKGFNLKALKKTGAESFARNCASCHGLEGKGDGKVAESLLPHPADLSLKQLSKERISYVLANGVYGTAMPAWRDLPQNELTGLVAYVHALGSRQGATKMPPQATAMILFAKNCSSCHGAGGEGDGPAAAALAPRPTNFHKVGPSPARALMVINDGIPGSSMPPWKEQLSMAERAILAAYVSSLYGDEHETGAAP